MKGKGSFYVIVLILLFNGPLLLAQNDSLKLSYNEFIENILSFHPVAKQADLKIKSAVAERLKAKGFLDPQITSNWQQKNFDEKLYYRQFQSYFTLPSRLGINIVGGYEYGSGTFLNPEYLTNDFGLWMAGIEIDLIQGLWINERQTALKQAKVFRTLAETQQVLMLNSLMLEASESYIEWQKYYAVGKVVEESIEIAENYFSNTVLSFNQGEKTALDTLEALLILQDALLFQQKNKAKMNKAIQILENYIWINDVPVILKDNIIPESLQNNLFEQDFPADLMSIVESHPLIIEKKNKRASYLLDLQLKREKLKPKLKAKYHPLLGGTEQNYFPDAETRGYRFGVDFSMPLLFRTARADVQLNKIKVQEVDFEIENKKNELLNSLENNLDQQIILENQIELQEKNVKGYQQLLKGEEQKFKFGESSVFLLNKRQEKYIQEKIKLIELKIEKSKLLLLYQYYSNNFAS